MTEQFDIIVIGGGIVGLTAALAMVLRGFSVAVIDRGSMTTNSQQPDPRVYAINQVSQTLLSELGIWQKLDQARLSPYQAMDVWDAANGASIEFNARMIAANHLGTIVEESLLKQALLHSLQKHQPKPTLITHTTITAIFNAKKSIRVETHQNHWEAKLVMVADGGLSPCRQLLHVPLTSWPYHQQALVALVKTEKPHQQTAYQVFNPDGPLAFLPLANQYQCSIVWSTSTHQAKRLMELSDEAFNQALTNQFAGKLGAVTVEGQRYQFPLIMRHAQQYVGERWLLLGDAAHTIHPLAGLGLNVGFEDIITWLNCLGENNDGLTEKRTLSAYQRQRKHAVWQIIVLLEGLKTLFSNPLPPVKGLRGIGLRLINHLTPVKRFFIEYAAGMKLRGK